MKLNTQTGLLCLFVSAIAFGCAEGGGTNTPKAEVTLSQNHHLWAVRSLPELSPIPIPKNETDTFVGMFTLRSDSKYEVVSGSDRSEESYFLDADGAMGVIVVPSASSGPIEFRGAYGLEGDTGVFYFLDQFTSAVTNPIGLFWGTRIVADAPEIEGEWHVFTQHLIFATSTTFSPANVARSFAGTVAIDSAGAVTGTGVESTKVVYNVTGTANPFLDGELSLTLDFADTQSNDVRTFIAGAGTPTGASKPMIVLGLDVDESTGESGFIAMVRHRTDAADPARLAGEYFIGSHAVLNDPGVRHTTTGHGTIEFNDRNGFVLEAERVGPGGRGEVVTHSGTYALADNGALVLTIPALNETWAGAVDQDYNTIVIVDNAADGANSNPEVSINLALRRVVAPL